MTNHQPQIIAYRVPFLSSDFQFPGLFGSIGLILQTITLDDIILMGWGNIA
jgi:hypothetical protein